jgi:hypothetical protein
MKKLILSFASAFMLFACSDDDNNNTGIQNPYTGDVTGDWKTVFVSLDDMAFSLDCTDENQFAGNFYYRFNTDGTLDVYHNCDVEGEIDVEQPVTTGTYTTTGNVLTVNVMGEEGKAHMIDNLDENQLILQFSIRSEGLFYGYDIVIEQVEE